MTVDVLVDLRDCGERPATPAEWADLWSRLEPALHRRPLRTGLRAPLGLPSGRVHLTFVAVPEDDHPIGPDTPFHVIGVIERAAVVVPCAECPPDMAREGRLSCVRCRGRDPERLLCEEHTIFLGGALQAYCAEHTPRCDGCDAPAVFWCSGCRHPWCGAHCRPDPNDSDRAYCHECHGDRFARCSTSGCRFVGNLRCEFFQERDGAICGRRVCTDHSRRWTIFGPRWLGLVLCPEHAEPGRLAPAELTFQLVAATLARQQRRRDRRSRPAADPSIPLAAAMRDIFRKARVAVPGFDEVPGRYAAVDGRLASGPLAELAVQRRAAHREALAQEYEHRIRPALERRDALLAQLRQLLLEDRQVEVAREIGATDFRPSSNTLQLTLRQDLRPHFFGRDHARRRRLQDALGVELRFDRDAR